MNGDDVAAIARGAFGWGGDMTVSAGPRGALGQIWQVRVGSDRYAFKELTDEPPSEASIRAELTFARCAASAGARVPVMHADREGRYLVETPAGTWLRSYEWIDLIPIDPRDAECPVLLGRLLAGLHRCAPAAPAEPDGGGPPDPWFDRLPDADELSAALASSPWAERFRNRLALLSSQWLTAVPVTAERLVLCHRDLHPQNVFRDTAGGIVVVDCDDLGPAEPGRELARVAFDWFCHHDAVDLEAVRVLFETYLAEGGHGRIAGPPDFTMLLACRLNFMVEQAKLGSDPLVDPHRRAWAESEFEEMLRLMPTSAQLDAVVAVAGSV